MNIFLEGTGLVTCGLVVVRYSYRAITGSSFGNLLSEGLKTMMDTPRHLQHCINWNISKRDHYRERYNAATNAKARGEASREVCHHQRNIDALNATQRKLDETN